MIKRTLLIIAVFVTIIGMVLHVNPYILLKVDGILILLVLGVALAPFSFGCFAPVFGAIPFAFILIGIITLIGSLWFDIFPETPITMCNSIIQYPNGTTFNTTVICP